MLRVRSMQAASVQHAYCKRTLVRAECLRMRIFGTSRACNMLAASTRTNHNARRMLVMCVYSQHPCVMLAGCLQDAHLAHEIKKDQHEKKGIVTCVLWNFLGLISSHMYMLYRSPGFKIPYLCWACHLSEVSYKDLNPGPLDCGADPLPIELMGILYQ